MAKARTQRTVYRCQACAHCEPRWLGRCPGCGEWNALVEERAASARAVVAASQLSEPISLQNATIIEPPPRLSSRVGELDRVLGGGFVPGSLVLLGGDPGVGKSTLLLRALDGLAEANKGQVLYVSGEESVAQTALRARRVGTRSSDVLLLAETKLTPILEQCSRQPLLCVAIDSIQTMFADELESVPGSIAQVRECAARLLEFAKTHNVAVILVGHVTKDGAIAGPKTLEHVVDVVLQFEGERASPYRLLRCHKNRFGSTQEIGVFEMVNEGLREVSNPSQLFLQERPLDVPGSVVVASAEGSRPILVEVQALVAPTSAAMARRTVAGVDGNRVSLLLAVLAQRAGCDVLACDVFVNLAGGVKLTEPAADLGVICALASAAARVAIPPRTLVFGEVGLAGEVRAVSMSDMRVAEARKLGFDRVVCPQANLKQLKRDAGIEIVGVGHVADALVALGLIKSSRARASGG